jgi:hypothetical protein
VIFGPSILPSRGHQSSTLGFRKSYQEKFTLYSLGPPMIMEGLMEESSILRDIYFLKGSPIANHLAA